MISFLEMAQQYPIGAKISVPGEDGTKAMQQEIVGYEYYNGTGYLLFHDREKVDVERLAGIHRDSVR
ncbi:MAG TPA: hypothetical protein DCZ91_04930 [Lachnospiraceae bacterium]|nr:hypothetical protein [Lachnospiraceae bacterium]